MAVKCPCQNCNNHLEFDAKDTGKTVTCPECGMETALFIPIQPSAALPLKAIPAAPAQMCEKERIRKETEYERARAIIDGVRTLSYIGTVIAVIIAVVAILCDQIWAGIVIVCGAVSSLVFIILVREALQAIFDIADCALNRHRNSK
jgi:urea transporter